VSLSANYDQILAAMAKLPRSTITDGLAYRNQPMLFPDADDLLAGEGPKAVGGRFNPVGVAAIYHVTTSSDAYLELKAAGEQPRPPSVLVSFKMTGGTYCEIVTPAARAAIGQAVSSSPLKLDDAGYVALLKTASAERIAGHETLEQAIGRASAESGCGLLRVPSVRADHDFLVAFPGAAGGLKLSLADTKHYAPLFTKHCPQTPLYDYSKAAQEIDSKVTEIKDCWDPAKKTTTAKGGICVAQSESLKA
jgi:RES domain-containing protein